MTGAAVPELSVIVPVHNERDDIERLHDGIEAHVGPKLDPKLSVAGRLPFDARRDPRAGDLDRALRERRRRHREREWSG